jgi:hypothetical protein
MSRDDFSSTGPGTETPGSASGNARKVADWLLVPASAGAVANVAALGIVAALGAPTGIVPAAAVAVAAGSALYKYLRDKSAKAEASRAE